MEGMEQVRELRSRVNPRKWVPVLLWRVKGVGERGTCRVHPITSFICVNGRYVYLFVFRKVKEGSHGLNVWNSGDSVWQKVSDPHVELLSKLSMKHWNLSHCLHNSQEIIDLEDSVQVYTSQSTDPCYP
jgi:hypothetical protein